MPLNEQQQAAFAEILRSDLFKTVEREVCDLNDESVDDLGSRRAALKLAEQKGVRKAFKTMARLVAPRTPVTRPVSPRLDRSESNSTQP